MILDVLAYFESVHAKLIIWCKQGVVTYSYLSTPLVRIDYATGRHELPLFFVLIHMQDESGHKKTSLLYIKKVYRCTGA